MHWLKAHGHSIATYRSLNGDYRLHGALITSMIMHFCECIFVTLGHTCISIYQHSYAGICTYVYMHVCICHARYTHKFMCVRTQLHIHMYMHMCTHIQMIEIFTLAYYGLVTDFEYT